MHKRTVLIAENLGFCRSETEPWPSSSPRSAGYLSNRHVEKYPGFPGDEVKFELIE